MRRTRQKTAHRHWLPSPTALFLGFLLAFCAQAASSASGAPEPQSSRAVAPSPPRYPASPDTLVILFTAETRGNLAPCECPKEPWGGLARRTRFLAQSAESLNPRTTLFRFDSGGFLPVGTVPLRDDPEVARRYLSLLLNGLNVSGMNAIALDHGQRSVLDSNCPLESRALKDLYLAADPPGAPILLDWDGFPVAVLALEETLTDAAIAAAVGRARSSASFLIVLGRADAISGRRLAEVSEADLVLLSRGARPPTPLRVGSSWLVGAGVDGREVAEVALIRTDDGLELIRYRHHAMDDTIAGEPAIEEATRILLEEEGPGWQATLTPLE